MDTNQRLYSETKMQNLFAYGTLMCADIMEEVSGYRLISTPAVLSGYRRCPVKDEAYPAIVPDANSSVMGVVYDNVPADAWQRLDRFEGEMYARRTVQIQIEGGNTRPAATFVAQPALAACLENAEWDFEDFLHRGMARFRKNYAGYRWLG